MRRQPGHRALTHPSTVRPKHALVHLYKYLYSVPVSLPHLLLGMLDAPASGYELKQMFDGTLRHLWAAELSQIYPALKRLEDDGYLSSRESPPAKGPARRVYRRTARGTRRLRQWLGASPEMGPLRLGYLGQLCCMAETGGCERTAAFLEELRDLFRGQLVKYEQVDAEWFRLHPGYPDALPPDLFHAHLTLRAGITRVEAAMTWCDESLRRVTKRT